ncbi:MAG: hypothetical protein ACXV2I_08465 [Actinomycetes bacterium]
MPDYPEDLDHPFTRGDLSLLQVGWREIRGPLWRTPYRNVHVWSATDPSTGLQRALDASLLLPDVGALGGWAAARVAGIRELDGRGVSGEDQSPVLLCLPPTHRVRRGPSVRPLRSPLLAEDVVEVDGVPVTSALRTAFDLGRASGSLEESVVALDVLARGNPGFLDEVAGYALERPRWQGVPRLRRALRLATDRSRSVGETRFRLLWVLDCGLPCPAVNADVLTGEGQLLGMVDLLDPESGLVGEYDGAVHLGVLRRAVDNARVEGLEGGGLVVVRATSPDLHRFRTRTRHRILAARGRALQRGPRGGWYWRDGPPPTPSPLW